VERVGIDAGGGNAVAAFSVVLGLLGVLAGPAAVVASKYSDVLTLHRAVALGGALAGLLGLLALTCARHGRFRAGRSVAGTGARAASRGRLLGTVALAVALAAAIALGTDAFVTHFQA
jgi:hypothetical protein